MTKTYALDFCAFCVFFITLVFASCANEDIIIKNEGGAENQDTIPMKTEVERLFDLDELPIITINVKKDVWDDLLRRRDVDKNVKDYFECDFSFRNSVDTFELKNCGLRLHGNTSRLRPEGFDGVCHDDCARTFRRIHYMVNLRKYEKDDDHEVHGVRKIIFKSFISDPAYVREIYSYNLFRRYGIWTMANASYCRFFIKIQDEEPVYLGVYSMLEVVDKQYIKRRIEGFGDDDGFLWKCGGVGMNDIDDNLFFIDDNSTVNHPYELKEGEKDFDIAKLQIKAFITDFHTKTGEDFHSWISSICDVELLLKTYAVNVALGNWDDYWNGSNNYYLYFNKRDIHDYKFFLIPYDYDECLGRTKIHGVQTDAVTHDPLNWGVENNILISKIISYPDFRKIYINALLELANSKNDYLNYSSSYERIQKWYSLISEYIANDTKEFMTIEDRPGPYSAQDNYRLLDKDNNFFIEKCKVLNSLFK